MKLTKASESQRIAAVVQVISLVQSGIKLEEALKKANISKDQYYYWISKSPDALELFYDLIKEGEKREISKIISARDAILDNLLEKATAKGAKISDAIYALDYIDRRQEVLESRQGVSNSAELDAQEYLKGPKLEKKQSRLVATVTIEGQGTVTVTTKENESDIIDSEFLPSQQDTESQER